MKFLSVFASFLGIILTGCATTKMPPPAVKRSIMVVEDPASVRIKNEDHGVFVGKLHQEMYGKWFNQGKDLTLRWKIIDCDRGSRALRYLIGFGAGRAEIHVEATVLNAKGKVLGSGVVEGDQTMGMYGGSFASAVEEAAEKVAEIAYKAAYSR